MEVIAICDYNDLELKRLVKKDELISVTKERAKELIKAKVCRKINTNDLAEKKVTKPKVKKKNK